MKKYFFKIGENCKGGVIEVQINEPLITLIGRDWDMSKGTNKNSDQSGAKEFTRLEVDLNSNDAHRKMSEFLFDLTTSYYEDKILEYIEKNSTFKKKLFW